MALFQTETVSSFQDAVEKIHDFLTTSGAGNPQWTSDVDPATTPANGEMAISQDFGSESVEVAFTYDGGGTPTRLGVCQYHTTLGAGNYNGAGNPWDQTGDSGNGAASHTNSTIATARNFFIGSTPIRYWAFTGSSPGHAYVVMNSSAGVYTHMGFGVLDKSGFGTDWTGGEFAFADKLRGGVTSSVAVQARSTMLLDGLCNGTSPDAMQNFCGTIHTEGLSDTAASGLWSVAMGNQGSGSLGNDRQGTPRARTHVLGGARAGTFAVAYGQFIGNLNTAKIESYPIVCEHWDRTTGDLTPLGVMPDVRGVLITNFEPEDTVVIGSDTWYIFPMREKYSGSGALTDTSGYQGIMYKANT